jgi:hypothetical protein
MSGAAARASAEPVPVPAALAALRSQGAERLDPLRFRFLEALAGRMAAASGPVQALIEARCQAALDDYTERFRQGRPLGRELGHGVRGGCCRRVTSPGCISWLHGAAAHRARGHIRWRN